MIHRIAKEISHLSDEIGLVIIIFLLISSFQTKQRNNKDCYPFVLLIISLFMIGWRLCYCSLNAGSSRYYLALIVIALLLCGNIVSHFRSIILIPFLICVSVLFNIFLYFSKFRGKYLIDVKDFYLNNEQYSFGIPKKDYYRFNDPQIIAYEMPEDSYCQNISELSTLINKYQFCENSFILSAHEAPLEYSLLKQSINVCTKKIASFITSSKNKRLTFYQLTPSNQIYYSESSYLRNGRDLIINGDFEEIETYENIQNKMKDWISRGADYYAQETVLLPKSSFLLPLWDYPKNNAFPRVFLDKSNPIYGYNSLHIISQDYAKVYFLNKIESTPGELSFVIKSNKNSMLLLGRYDYRNKKIIKDSLPEIYRISLPNNKTIQISIAFHLSSFLGDHSLFYIEGYNLDLLIDRISYITSQ